MVLISFGFLKIAIPQIPFRLPQVANLRELFLWIRGLPSVNQSIEVYGGSVNLDAMIYFIFHAFGFALMLTLVAIMIYPLLRTFIITLITLLLGVSALALINESVFVAAAPSIVLLSLLFQTKKLLRIRTIFILLILTTLIILLQGGVVTNSIFKKDQLEASVLFFPQKEDIKEDFISYHHYQSISKALPNEEKWLAFSWFHIGVDALIIASAILLIIGRFDSKQKAVMLTLLVSGILSLVAYYFIVPKFLIANGNRLLVFAYMYLSLLLVYGLFFVITSFKKVILSSLLIVFLVVFIFLPSILPPLALLSKTRFGENKLIPRQEQMSEGTEWIKKNLPYDTKIMVLDVRAPHPSGVSKVLVQAGVFTPIFPGDFRTYTMEASPEYLDIAYFLDPAALKKLKIEVLMIDSQFLETLPDLRKKQLNDDKYFKILFSKAYPDKAFEKVLKIENFYIEEGGELEGTIRALSQILPTGQIYIDNEENFTFNFLRRAIIFSLRGKDIYFLPQSGVYLNVETDIPSQYPRQDNDYDFLVLSKKTDPSAICKCQPKLYWKGLRDEIMVWNVKRMR